MGNLQSERRLVENEAMFRKINQHVLDQFEYVNQIAKEDGQLQYVNPQAKLNTPLYFYCECADEKCTNRIAMDMRTYEKIHKAKNRFIITPGHDVAAIERVVTLTPTYAIVEKHSTPPDHPGHLHSTTLHTS